MAGDVHSDENDQKRQKFGVAERLLLTRTLASIGELVKDFQDLQQEDYGMEENRKLLITRMHAAEVLQKQKKIKILKVLKFHEDWMSISAQEKQSQTDEVELGIDSTQDENSESSILHTSILTSKEP